MTELIWIGGVFHLAFAVFHLCFWRLFGWKHDLPSLTFVNRQIIQILNLCLTFVFLAVGWISLTHAGALTDSALGRNLLLLIAAFWLLRAVWQIVFFGLGHRVSLGLFVVFIAGGGLYLVPWIAGSVA